MSLFNNKTKVLCLLLINTIAVCTFAQKSIAINQEFTSKTFAPAKGKVISHYGMRNHRMHTGTDVKLNKNDTIVAAFDGVIKKSEYFGGYGNLVIVQHKQGVETYYSHLTKSAVKINDSIKAGELIGFAGATGRATTTHLHFEIRIDGKTLNPNYIFNFENNELKTSYIQLKYDTEKPINLLATASNDSTATSIVDVFTEPYVVKKNDTLYAIAKKHNTSIGELCLINNISKTATLRIGQTIKISQ